MFDDCRDMRMKALLTMNNLIPKNVDACGSFFASNRDAVKDIESLGRSNSDAEMEVKLRRFNVSVKHAIAQFKAKK
jgi:hypothetical protein